MSEVLEGVRVIDLTHGPAGGLATMIMADFGAEVLVIDAPKPHSCLLYTSPSPRDATLSRMPSSA